MGLDVAPVRSSSSGQYESSPDIKTLPCFSSGEYKSHTVSLFLSDAPSSPVVSCELLPRRRASLLAANESATGQSMPVHFVIATAAARTASGWGRPYSETTLDGVSLLLITLRVLQSSTIFLYTWIKSSLTPHILISSSVA